MTFENVDPVVRRRFQHWMTLVLLLIPALSLLIWAGAAADPRRCVPWNWTKTGWIIPASGLTFVWISSGLFFGLLSGMAFLLFHPVPPGKKMNPWISAAAILVVAIVVRIITAGVWMPLPLDPAGI